MVTVIVSVIFTTLMTMLLFLLPPQQFLMLNGYETIFAILTVYLFCGTNYLRAIFNLRRLSTALERGQEERNGIRVATAKGKAVRKKLSSKVKHLSVFLLPYFICAFPIVVARIVTVASGTSTHGNAHKQVIGTLNIIGDLCYSMLGGFTLFLLGQKLIVFYCGCWCRRTTYKEDLADMEESPRSRQNSVPLISDDSETECV